MRFPPLSKLILRMLLGTVAILLMVSACRQEQASVLEMNRELPPAALEARLDPGEATLGDRVTYTLSLSRAPEITSDFPEPGASPEGLTPVDSGRSGPVNERGRISEKRWTTYRADRVGTWVFPAVKMQYQQNGEDKETATQEITLQVKSVLTEEMTDIHGIKPLEEPKRSLRLLLAIAVLAVILIFAAYRAWSWWNKREKPMAIQPPLPPHLEAEQSLRVLEAMELIARGDFKKHYFLLSEIFRRYVERRFAFPAVERTTEEIMAALDALTITVPLKDEIRTFLRNTEPVKFAGVGSTREEARAETDRVRRFVAETSRQAPALSEEREHVAV